MKRHLKTVVQRTKPGPRRTEPGTPRAFARTLRGPLVPILAAFDAEERLDIDST